MTKVDENSFLREYSEVLGDGKGALFVGAGVSRGAGYVDWAGLLESLASDLGLEVEREADLEPILKTN